MKPEYKETFKRVQQTYPEFEIVKVHEEGSAIFNFDATDFTVSFRNNNYITYMDHWEKQQDFLREGIFVERTVDTGCYTGKTGVVSLNI